MRRAFKFVKKPLVIILVIIIAAGIFVYFYFVRKPAALPETAVAKRGAIIQEVSVTGRAKPAEDIDLAFEQAGKIRRVYIGVGDKVFSGQVLVELNSSELYSQLAEAEATVESEKAQLDELVKGATPEEIAVYEIKLLNSQVSFNDAKKNLIDRLQDAYTKSDDAIRANIDQLFSNPSSPTPSLLFSSYLKIELESGRVLTESTLNSWQLSLNNIFSAADLSFYNNSAENNLEQIKLFLGKVALAVSALTPNSNLTQATINTYTSSVSTARTNVNSAIINLQTAEEKFNSAVSAVNLAEKELIQKQASATAEQISNQEALVKQYEASADIIKVKIGKDILRSPINGVVTQQDAKVGEIAAANAVIVSVISEGFSAKGGPAFDWELEANIPEADIAKVKINDSAKVTFDAFGNSVIFDAKVTKIDPGETVLEGVATYKTTFNLMEGREDIKSGMTANIDILTAQKEDVIYLPQRAVILKGEDKFVRILEGEIVKEVKVETGIRGSDGNIEIIKGVKEGDKVVISVK